MNLLWIFTKRRLNSNEFIYSFYVEYVSEIKSDFSKVDHKIGMVGSNHRILKRCIKYLDEKIN